MGKLIQFPIDRLRNRRYAAAHVFDAFGDLESIQRSQLKLLAGSTCFALVLTFVLQLTLG